MIVEKSKRRCFLLYYEYGAHISHRGAALKQTFDITHPHIYAQWVDIGDGRDPANYTHGSSQIFRWQCDEYKNHQWDSKIKVRSMGAGCAICANRVVLQGFNDLETNIPTLAAQWDYEKNAPLTPSEVVFVSAKKYWWICTRGHSIYSNIHGRKSKTTGEYNVCAACYGRIAVEGQTDLNTVLPSIASQCISEVDTSSITAYSSQELKWKCPEGHIEDESPKLRSRRSYPHCKTCSENRKYKNKKDKEEKKNNYKKTKESNFLSVKNPKIFSQLVDKESHKEISYNSAKKVEWVCEKNHTWICTVYQRVNHNSGCPTCNEHHYTSKGEKAVVDHVKNIYNGEIIENTRSVIHPYELDIYIPEKKIAIEYNGLYWHSDQAGKSDTYHYDKWKRCADKGIQLISIWEDDWNYREDIVKRMIAHKLGVSNDRKVYARQTDVVIVDKDDARAFCNAHHIQGYVSGSVYYGLKDRRTDSLVAVSVWKRSGDQLRLERYCTSENVIGGMGKMLKAGVQYAKDNGLSKIVTFSDHDVSDGGLYRRLGFIPDKELKPDYKYIVGGTRVHKFNYRIKRFRDDPNLKYADGLTESELAQMNSLPRVYDAGKTRWAINVS